MKPTVYMSECGYYMLHQYDRFWIEFFQTVSGAWEPQHGQPFAAGNKNDGQFTGFNNHEDGSITYRKEWV